MGIVHEVVLFITLFAAGLFVAVFATIVWLTGYWRRMAEEFLARKEGFLARRNERLRRLETLGVKLFPKQAANINPG